MGEVVGDALIVMVKIWPSEQWEIPLGNVGVIVMIEHKNVMLPPLG